MQMHVAVLSLLSVILLLLNTAPIRFFFSVPIGHSPNTGRNRILEHNHARGDPELSLNSNPSQTDQMGKNVLVSLCGQVDPRAG